jgi:propionyl-CoA carboxylase beta chain
VSSSSPPSACYIDDVIMPHSTWRRIARALAMPRDKKVKMAGEKAR